jgi:hypothetical protein
MVRWVLQNRNGDPNRVFVTGASSGGMMTNVLLGDYPDVFKAGSAYMGVPFACFATTDGSMWNTACANGQIIRTGQQWGDLVRGAFPGFTGARPRMQVFHGTADEAQGSRDAADDLVPGAAAFRHHELVQHDAGILAEGDAAAVGELNVETAA